MDQKLTPFFLKKIIGVWYNGYMPRIYSGGTPVRKLNKTYVIVSSNEGGVEEVELNSCHSSTKHYLNQKGVCLVCGFINV